MNSSEHKALELLELYPDIQKRFREAGWEQFFSRCASYHEGVARAFMEGFNGQQVTVVGISFPVIEELIVEVTGLPADGEREFKSHFLASIDVPFFLKDELKGMSWHSRV